MRESKTLRNAVYLGAAWGFRVWLVYAAAECLFLSVAPWLTQAAEDYHKLHWGFTALLFLIYPLLGILLGALMGLLFHGIRTRWKSAEAERTLEYAAKFSLLAVFGVNLVRNNALRSHTLPVLGGLLFLLVALAFAAGSRKWSRRIGFATGAWTLPAILLGTPWITREVMHGASSEWSKALGAAAWMATVLIGALILHRIGEGHTISAARPTRFWGQPLLVAGLLLGLAYFPEQKPLGAIPLLPARADEIRDRPNVVLIVLDTVRADHLPLYGYERDTSPNLRRFAEEATLYQNGISTADMTLPSHASMFTGLYGSQHGAHFTPALPAGRPLERRFETMAELLSDFGYRTLGVVANKGYLQRAFGMDQGFEYYDFRSPSPFLEGLSTLYLRQRVREFLKPFAHPRHFETATRRADQMNEEVFSLLDRVDPRGDPFFLFLNYMDAHWPYIPPEPFDTRYPGKNPQFQTRDYNAVLHEVMSLERNIRPEEFDHLVSQYDGAIAYLDSQIGKLFGRLKERRLYDDSLIIVTSDHGETFGERNLVNHMVSAYQDQVHIPLLVKYPSQREGAVEQRNVSLVDLLPTVMDVCGLDPPEGIQGVSLLKLDGKSERMVFAESFPSGAMLELHSRFHRVERAIFSGPLKLITSSAGKRELYDLSVDPSEQTDISAAERAELSELEARMNEWIRGMQDAFEPASGFTKEQMDRLRSLGYIR